MNILRGRGPVVTGSIAAVALLVLLGAAIGIPRLAFQAGTRSYTAEFANAAGISGGDRVYVAGVPAGKVTSVNLAGDRVRVNFRLDGEQPLGTSSTAGIKLATVLGTRLLSVTPRGPGQLPGGATIPLERTSVPYSLGQLGSDTGQAVQKLDLGALREAAKTLQGSIQDPELVGKALTGLTGVADMVNKRGAQFQELLGATKSLTGTLLGQRETLLALLGDARMVADTLNARRNTIRKLIDDVHGIATIVERLFTDTRETLGPLLSDLHSLTDSLERKDAAIGSALEQLGPASRYLANATGNGPWGDVAGPVGPIPDNLLCLAGLMGGCR